jgi:hypothetical protein
MAAPKLVRERNITLVFFCIPTFLIDYKSVFQEGKAFFSCMGLTCVQGAVLKATKRGRKRNRIIVALLFPALVLVWLVGWSLYWIGRKKEGEAKPPRKRGAPNITLIPAMSVEKEQAEVKT